MKQPLDQGVETVNPILLGGLVAAHLAPGVVELVGGKQVAHLVAHPVTEDAQGVIDKQLGDIAPVAHAQLPPGVIGGGGLFAHRRFKLEHHQRQAVDIQDGIGDAQLQPAVAALTFDLQLIDQPEDIVTDVGGQLLAAKQPRQLRGQLAGIQQLDIEIFLLPIFAFEQKAVAEPLAEGLVALVQIAGGQTLQLLQYARNLAVGDAIALIVACQIVAQIVGQQHLGLGGAGYIAADPMGVAGLTRRRLVLPQQGDNGLFQLAFGKDMAHGNGFFCWFRSSGRPLSVGAVPVCCCCLCGTGATGRRHAVHPSLEARRHHP